MGRPNARGRGYGSAWDQARAAFLRKYPKCARCGAPADTVHHTTPHRGNMAVFWDRARWQPVCTPCHAGPCQFEDQHGYSNEIGADGAPLDPNHPFLKG